MTTSNTDFNYMLKKYMPYKLLDEEVKARNYFWNKCPKDENWFKGRLEVPFYGAEASSFSMGALVSSDDISESKPVLGYVDTFREMWGTMKFNELDLDLHGDLEASFLKIYPDQLTKFIGRMSERISLMLQNGFIDSLTANGGSSGTGLLVVAHPERFTIGEKIYLHDNNSAADCTDHVFVGAINMSTKTLSVGTTRALALAGTYDDTCGGTGNEITDYTTAQNAKIYIQGGQTSSGDTAETQFSSLRSMLLSSANGGSASILNQTKTAYPFLQAQQIDGSTITAANTLSKAFDSFMEVLTLGKGNASEMIVSFKDFANMAKSLEVARDFTVTDKKSGYGWRSISVLGPEGEMDITGIRETETDVNFIIDWAGVKFHGSHFFDRKRHLNGNEFYLTRATTGYSYIVDIRFFGDLVVSMPSHCGIVHSISY